ncbi:hypothetical protein [Paludisphaera borealis]|uniref:Uncharacterized protein n=1 Tax=Paludisphaera borealis TaxID=1387353 RepID=A0A1U7CZ26_9BACT|nr:hypothetical protein [Paludisphaera borealis]APW64143.1 hypothetical protein BSF38_05735 [Paludisphaera borealis]
MNPMRLLRFAPTLVILGVLIYCAQAIDETLASRPRVPKVETLASVLARLGLDAIGAGEAAGLDAIGAGEAAGLDAETDALAVRRLRDPFNLEAKSAESPNGPDGPKTARGDRHAEFVDQAVLNATFIQNKTRLAVINGKLYKQGQAVAGTGQGGASALVVHTVKPDEVVLTSDRGSYALTYSDRLTNAKAAGGRRGGSPRRGPAVSASPVDVSDPQLALIRAILGAQFGAVGSSLTNALGLPQAAPGRVVARP